MGFSKFISSPRTFLSGILTAVMYAGTVSGCSLPNDRELVFFSGDRPIYQIGTCDNLVGSATFYMNYPDSQEYGIDGGKGKYTIECSNENVATVAFAPGKDGYERIRITPVGAGIAKVTLGDKGGKSVSMSIIVYEYYRWYWNVKYQGFIYAGEDNLTQSEKEALENNLQDKALIRENGWYEAIPDDRENSLYGGGRIKVFAGMNKEEYKEGRYSAVRDKDSGLTLTISLEDGIHEYRAEIPEQTDGLETDFVPTLYEDMTQYSASGLPEGCKVYRAETWRATRHKQ